MKPYTSQQVTQSMSDTLFREAYGPDWQRIQGATLFQHNYGFEKPAAIHGWQWSTTFGRWSALVTFDDGWHGYAYPKYS